MKNLISRIVLPAAAVAASLLLPSEACAQAKYVFYFIGDGMGMGHVNTTETYNRDVLKNTDPILMLRFPVASQVRTYSANSPITDSAAAGTALSTGHKTNNGTVGMSPDKNNVYSISTDFLKAGYAVGVASTVAGDDATPSAFYAHAPERGEAEVISMQAPGSGISFLGAPVFRGAKSKKVDWKAAMEQGGYTIVNDYATFEALPEMPDKTLLLSSVPFGDQAGFTIDSIAGALTAEQLTRAALRQLESENAPGFFLMTEGGNIDWAAHANDGGTVIKEILNFQKAIDVAYQFYLAHPEETLIVITADHDTGGMALGRRDAKKVDLSLADFQKISKDRFVEYCRKEYKPGSKLGWKEMENFLKANLGFWDGVKLTDDETSTLKDSFEKTFVTREAKGEKTLYNDFNDFSVKVYDILNRHLGIGWTTSSHTGNPVPLFAIGEGSELFTSNLDNISVPMLILKAAGLERKCSGGCCGAEKK